MPGTHRKKEPGVPLMHSDSFQCCYAKRCILCMGHKVYISISLNLLYNTIFQKILQEIVHNFLS